MGRENLRCRERELRSRRALQPVIFPERNLQARGQRVSRAAEGPRREGGGTGRDPSDRVGADRKQDRNCSMRAAIWRTKTGGTASKTTAVCLRRPGRSEGGLAAARILAVTSWRSSVFRVRRLTRNLC